MDRDKSDKSFVISSLLGLPHDNKELREALPSCDSTRCGKLLHPGEPVVLVRTPQQELALKHKRCANGDTQITATRDDVASLLGIDLARAKANELHETRRLARLRAKRGCERVAV